MYALDIPFSEIRPSKKLFKPRQIPARKLGRAKNFLSSYTW
jgi:hypothetical protein